MLAIAAAVVWPAAASAAPDLGDAPDGAPAGYVGKPSVAGAFPSKLASRGPRHDGAGALRLGLGWSDEPDSLQVDRDDGDDGASFEGRRCATSTLTTVIDTSRLPAAERTSGTVYVNAWFDFNRDGDWDDASDGCAPEWAIRNLPVKASEITGGKGIVPIELEGGKQVAELWFRVTVTLGEPAIDGGGRGRAGAYANGETEDYLQVAPRGSAHFRRRPPRKPPPDRDLFTARCVPAVSIIAHGGTATFRLAINSPRGKRDIYGSFPGGRSGKGFGITLLPHPNQGGVPAGFTRAIGFRFKSKDVDAPLRIQRFTVTVRLARGKVVRIVTCVVLVVHVGKQGQKIPKRACPGPCRGAPVPAKPLVPGPRYRQIPGGGLRIEIPPLIGPGGITIPLTPPNPVPQGPPRLTGSSPPVECELVPLTLTGGPATLRCKPVGPPIVLDSFFDVFFDVPLPPTRSIFGELLGPGGSPTGRFDTGPAVPPAPPPPPPQPPPPTAAGATPAATTAPAAPAAPAGRHRRRAVPQSGGQQRPVQRDVQLDRAADAARDRRAQPADRREREHDRAAHVLAAAVRDARRRCSGVQRQQRPAPARPDADRRTDPDQRAGSADPRPQLAPLRRGRRQPLRAVRDDRPVATHARWSPIRGARSGRDSADDRVIAGSSLVPATAIS